MMPVSHSLENPSLSAPKIMTSSEARAEKVDSTAIKVLKILAAVLCGAAIAIGVVIICVMTASGAGIGLGALDTAIETVVCKITEFAVFGIAMGLSTGGIIGFGALKKKNSEPDFNKLYKELASLEINLEKTEEASEKQAIIESIRVKKTEISIAKSQLKQTLA